MLSWVLMSGSYLPPQVCLSGSTHLSILLIVLFLSSSPITFVVLRLIFFIVPVILPPPIPNIKISRPRYFFTKLEASGARYPFIFDLIFFCLFCLFYVFDYV